MKNLGNTYCNGIVWKSDRVLPQPWFETITEIG